MSTDPGQHIYVLRVTRLEMLTEGPTADEAEHLQAHASHIERLTEDGIVLMAGRTQTADASTFGLVILAASSNDAAADVMASDPAISGGVMTGELFPYNVAFVSPDILNAP